MTQFGYQPSLSSPAARRMETRQKEMRAFEERKRLRRIRENEARLKARQERDRQLLGPMERIAREVAEKHGLTVLDLRKHRRRRPIILARHEAMWRLYDETVASLPAIGRFFGFDHTTVLNSINSHERRMRGDA